MLIKLTHSIKAFVKKRWHDSISALRDTFQRDYAQLRVPVTYKGVQYPPKEFMRKRP
jgi:hypothetical protein